MALETECQTPDARYHINVNSRGVTINVEFGFWTYLSDKQAETLEINLHNAVELALAPIWVRLESIPTAN